MRIFLTTWNLGNSKPQGDIGEYWLKDARRCQIIAIGIQEGKASDCLDKCKEIFPEEEFVLLKVVTLWNISLIVYVQKPLKRWIHDMKTAIKPTGFANYFGNKGGVLVTFKIFQFSIAFLNCHLAAGPDQQQSRICILSKN